MLDINGNTIEKGSQLMYRHSGIAMECLSAYPDSIGVKSIDFRNDRYGDRVTYINVGLEFMWIDDI